MATTSLADMLGDRQPRVLVLSAPPGYDKLALLRAYGAARGSFAACTLRAADRAQTFGTVLDALAAADPALAASVSAARLQSPADIAVGLMRDAWTRHGAAPAVLALREGGGLATAHGVELLHELIATAPPGRVLALAVHDAPRGLDALLPDLVRLSTAELALDASDAPRLATQWAVGEDVAAEAIAAAGGGPLAARCLAAAAGAADPARLRAGTRDLAAGDRLAYAVLALAAQLDPGLLHAVLLLARNPDLTEAALADLCGEEYDLALLRRLERLPFVERDGDALRLHPSAGAALGARYAERSRRIALAALDRAERAGAPETACAAALALGDAERAARIADASARDSALPLALCERIVERLERAALPRFPAVWLATIPFRRFAVDRATYVREAAIVYRCLPPSASAARRADALVHLASAERNEGRCETAHELLREGLDGFAGRAGRPRALLLGVAATLYGIEGRFARARELAGEADAIERTTFRDDLTLHYIDAHEAFFRGWSERGFLVIDEVLRSNRTAGGPLYTAYAAMNGAVFAWGCGDDARWREYVAALEAALTPGLQRGFAPVLDGFHGRPLEGEDRFAWPVQTAIGRLFRIGAARGAAALEHARAAATAADACRDPYLQMLAYTAQTVLEDDAARRAAAGAALQRALAEVESPEARAAAAALVRGAADTGMLAPLIAAHVRPAAAAPAPRLTVELLACRATRGGVDVGLTQKELELVGLLAASRAPLARDAIGEALWPHVAQDDWPNNVKVTVSRVRGKCRARDAILVDEGRYRLSPDVEIDLRALESMLRAHSGDELAPAARRLFEAAFAPYRDGAPSRFERFEWFAPMLVRIGDAAGSIGLALARDALVRGSAEQAVEFADAVLAIDEYREDACEVALLAERARGGRAAAQLRFRRYAARLRAELDVEPSARLRALLAEGAPDARSANYIAAPPPV